MKYLRYIPVGFITVVFAVYDFNFVTNNTNWDIFYFASIYLTLMFICLREAFGNIKSKLFFGVLFIGFGIRLFSELKQIGANYDQYMNTINNQNSSIMYALWITLLLFIVTLKIWKS